MTDLLAALLPPASGPFLALCLLLGRCRRVACVVVAVLVLLSMPAVPHLLVGPLLLSPGPVPARPPRAIVVLASGMPELLDTSRTAPGIETLALLRAAAAVSRRTGTPVLVSGARSAEGTVPVAAAMARSLRADFAVRPGWVETGSTNLWQSAAASAAMLAAAGIGDIYLVAQPWELRLRSAVFRDAGLSVTPAPVPHAAPRPLGLDALLPLTSSWVDSAVALGEWAGLACQALPPCVTWMRGATPDPS